MISQKKSYAFEAIKKSLRQTGAGGSVTLTIHPDDLPDGLLSDPIGSRYMVGMGRIDDQEKIEPLRAKACQSDGGKALASCAALCRNSDYQGWLFGIGLADEISESEASNITRQILELESRSELKENLMAQDRWLFVRKLFNHRPAIPELHSEDLREETQWKISFIKEYLENPNGDHRTIVV